MISFLTQVTGVSDDRMRLQIENPSLSSSAALSSSSSSSSSSSPSPFLELQVKDMDDVTTCLTGTYRARESRDENDNIISHACARHCLDSANFPLPDPPRLPISVTGACQSHL